MKELQINLNLIFKKMEKKNVKCDQLKHKSLLIFK